MIIRFGNEVAVDIWETSRSKILPREYWIRTKALLTIMHSTSDLNDLKIKEQPPNARLHKLKGDRKEYWSVTINYLGASLLNLKMMIFMRLKLKTITKDDCYD